MLYSKMPVPFLALLMTAACGNAPAPTDSLHNEFSCRSCGFNGLGIYEDAVTNANFGLRSELAARNLVLLGFENGFAGNISGGVGYVKSNWATLTIWGGGTGPGGPLTNSVQQLDVPVSTVTYRGTTGYTLKSIVTDDSQNLTVTIRLGTTDTVVTGSSLANLTIVVQTPFTISGHANWDIQFAAPTNHLGDPWDNHYFHYNGNESLIGYQLTTRYTGAGAGINWNAYCQLGLNPPDGGNGDDYMIPLNGVRINHGNGDILSTGPNNITLACRGGALAVMTDMGYKNGIPGWNWHILHAASLAKTEMPCNDGYGYTTPGVTYRFADSMSTHVQDPAKDFDLGAGQNYELYWNHLGAMPPNGIRNEAGLGNDRAYKVGSPLWDQTDTSGANWCGVGVATNPVTLPTTSPAWSIVTRPCNSL